MTTDTNPTPTQPETLEPPEVIHVTFCSKCGRTGLHNTRCSKCGNKLGFEDEIAYLRQLEQLSPELVERVANYLEGNRHDNPLVLAHALRRAAVTAPRGDVATTARNRDVAQRVVMSTEGVLGERFDIATRHELADRITAALDAAPSSLTPAHHKHCSSWTVTTSGEKKPCDCVCECSHTMYEHIRPGEHYWYKDCAVEGCACMKFIAAPAERTRVEGEQEDRDPLVDMMMPIIYKAATEPCRNYARGCPANQPDQSFWCAPCEAREAKEIIESDSEIVSRYCLAAPADNDAE